MENVADNRNFPTERQIETELRRLKRQKIYHKILQDTLFSLVIVAAAAVLAALLFLPIFR